MKNLNLLAVIAIAVSLLFATEGKAQLKGQSVAGFHIGQSLTGALVRSAEDVLATGSVDIGGTPALQLAYDYGLTDWFSLGAAFSFQTFGFDYTGYEFVNSDNMLVTEDFTARTSRMTAALRPLFHYGNKGGKLDLYSGLRLQYVFWSGSNDSSDPTFEVADFTGGRPGVGIIPFGLRYFFTDNIGAGVELMWGAPYLASINVNARFGGSASAAPTRGGSTRGGSSRGRR